MPICSRSSFSLPLLTKLPLIQSNTMSSNPNLDLSSSDLPPESFWVPTTDEQDWFNHNAVMQRKTSLKLAFNRNYTSFSHRSDLLSNPKPSRPSVFAVPNLVHKTGAPDPDKKPARFLFRSRSEPGGRPVAHASEPGSPRVSCTGRVRFRGDGKKTGFSRLLSSLFPAKLGKSRSRKR